MKKFIQPIVYGVSGLVYLDIFLNPKKGFVFLKIKPGILSVMALLAVLCLLFLIGMHFFKKLIRIRKITALLFLGSALIIINELLFSYSFYQPIDFILTLLLAAPIAFVLNNLLGSWSQRLSGSLLIGSLILLFSTLAFFIFIYAPYEDYVMGFPIVFVHHWIRNWLILISLLLLSTVLLKGKVTEPKSVDL